MKTGRCSNSVEYTAQTIVSPMMLGDDKKDQDRARWHEPCQVAGVFDGVSSSPNSAEAAELAVRLLPALFVHDPHDRFAILCDLLMANRQECMEDDEVDLPDNMPPAMRDMISKVVRQKRAESYQTTMVAARITTDEHTVTVDVMKCGDSALFGFSEDGQLLTSSLEFPLRSSKHRVSLCTDVVPVFMSKRIAFGPGDEIFVRIEGRLSKYSSLADLAGIDAEYRKNWFVCTPVDNCRDDKETLSENLSELKILSLEPGDQLLVPRYLHGTLMTSEGRRYLLLRYSSAIRTVSIAPAEDGFNNKGAATMVLPDHYYCGGFDLFRDRFPLRTNFILCSDGFYSSFSSWEQLWSWLQSNASGLADDKERDGILERLHHQLHARVGDDDISFIWVRPREPESAATDLEGGDEPCQQKS
jgi:serine/threonine protein phosphatase PrpC